MRYSFERGGSGPPPSRWLLAGLVLMHGLLLLTLMFGSRVAFAQSSEATPDATPAITGEPASGETTEPRQVTVGFYLTSIYDLDQQANSYYADFYMWMRWQGEDDPTSTVEFLNNIERWGLTMTPVFEEPQLQPSGEFLQQFHVQGQFYQPLSLSAFPLDSHGLTIQIEDSTYFESQLVYVLDLEQSGIAPGLKLPGWSIEGWKLESPQHRYATGFGEQATSSQEYSTARFTLQIERPASFFTWKLMLPLIIVLLLGCSVLLIHPTFTEVRLAGPATALLTLVFLQETYTSSLPENGSLVLLDKIYALAYALVIGLIGMTIVTSHWMRVDEDANAARAERLDRVSSIGLFVIFAIGTAIVIATGT